MSKPRTYTPGFWMIALILAIGAPLVFTGCGGCSKEEPKPAPSAKVVPPEKKPVAEPPKKAEPPKLEAVAEPAAPPVGEPVVAQVLKLTPESAMISIGVPPLSKLQEELLPLAKLILAPDTDVDAELAEAVAKAGEGAGVPDAKSFADIVRAKGLNPDAPVGLFVDLTAAAVAAKAMVGTMGAPESEKPAGSAEAEDAKPAAEKEANKEAAPAEAKPALPAAAIPAVDLESLKVPALVIVAECLDPVKAETSLKDFVNDSGQPSLDPSKIQDIESGGVVVHCYNPDELAYFISGNKLVVGTNLNMLNEVLARMSAPASIRYGTAECPASDPNELAMLVRMDRLVPLFGDLIPVVAALDPRTAAMMQSQAAAMMEAATAYAGDDPTVVTLSVLNGKIEALARVDLGNHPGLAAAWGQAKPLRLASVLPESTLVILAIQANEMLKQSLKTKTQAYAQSDPGFQQVTENVAQALEHLGDEITVGITGMDAGGLPQLYLMMALKDPQKTRELIETLAPLTPEGDPYNTVQIYSIAVPLPIPLFLAFPGDVAVLCNDADKMKGIIDLLTLKSVSNLFASLNPKLDPATPRYNAFVVNTKILTDVVIPFSSFAGGLPPTVLGPVNKVSDLLREIRFLNEVNKNWSESRLTFYLKEAKAATPAEGVPPAAAPGAETPAAEAPKI